MPDLYQEIITRTPAGRWGHADECAGAAVSWRPEHPILSLVLPSALTAVIRSDNPDEDEEFAPFESPEPSAHTAV